MAGLTRSQSLFSVYMGLDARALEINGSNEFFLFMDLRAERRWVSYNTAGNLPLTFLHSYELV